MDLGTLVKTSKARYGLSRFGTEDELFNWLTMRDCANEAHRWLAERTGCYRQTQTYDLPVSSNGTSAIGLECNVIRHVPGTLRILYGGTWRQVWEVTEDEARRDFGVFENVAPGIPLRFFPTVGDALDAQRVLELLPGSDTEVLEGLKLNVEIYPALMTDEMHTPALQPAEHRHLIPITCWQMALLDASRGRADAPVGAWEQQAHAAVADLRRVMGRWRGEPRRVRYEPDDYC